MKCRGDFLCDKICANIPGMKFEKPSVDRELSLDVERQSVLRDIVNSIEPRDALLQDRASCWDERLFLSAVLRTPKRPMADVVAILRKKLEAPKISDQRRGQIADHIGRLSNVVDTGPVLDLPDMFIQPRATVVAKFPPLSRPTAGDPHAFAEDEPTVLRDNSLSLSNRPVIAVPALGPVDFKMISAEGLIPVEEEGETPLVKGPETITRTFGRAGDSMRMVELPVLSEELTAERDALALQERKDAEGREAVVLMRGFDHARSLAEQWVADKNNIADFEGVLASTLDAVAEAHEDLEQQYSFPVACIRGKITAELRVAYFGAVERAGDDSYAFRDAFRSYVSLRARLGALLRVESRLMSLSDESTSGSVEESRMTLRKARNVLGVFDNAGRNDVEQAYAIRLQALDLQNGADAIVMRGLMRARDTLLESVENQEELRRLEREAADRVPALAAQSLDGGRLEISEANPEPIVPQMQEHEAAKRLAEEKGQNEIALPHRMLGVSEGASRREIEEAYAARTEMLDMDRATDRREIAALQSAYSVMLHQAELREGATRSVKVSTQAAAPKTSSEEGWLTRLARKPGNILRGLFFGGAVAAGAGAAGVILNEFSGTHADPMHDVGHDYSLGVIPGPFDGVGDLSGLIPKVEVAAPRKIEAPLEQIRLIPHGSWILKETGAMLRERGLKPTNALTSYFAHQIEAVNAESIAAAGGANHLPDNFPLIVTPIVDEMNAMAGIVPAASEPLVVKKSASESSLNVSGGSSIERASVAAHERVVPTVDSPMRVMAKGEYLGKVTHSMLRAGGLNWTTARINQLNDMVWQKNLPLFERLVQEGKMRKLKPEYIPIGVELDFSSAAQEVQRLVAAKKPAKKGG